MRITTVLLSILVIALLVVPAPPIQAQQGPPLSQPGPYTVGERTVKFVDVTRDNRELVTELWYPAIAPANPNKQLADLLTKGHRGWPNAVPDGSGKSYPLILYSHWLGGERTEFTSHLKLLASYGFVVAAPNHPNSHLQTTVIDRPLDILFLINQLGTLKAEVAGPIDINHIGVMGFDYGAYTTLTVTGARIDPAAGEAIASRPIAPGDPRLAHTNWDWQKLTAYYERFAPLKPGDLWPPFTDKRVRGALMHAPCTNLLFSPKGLAAATVPTLMIAGIGDKYCPYDQHTLFIFNNLGSPDRYLISVVTGGHVLSHDPTYDPILSHFEVAFFGYYLQGKQDYAQYLTAQYVDSLEAQVKLGLVWGPYKKP